MVRKRLNSFRYAFAGLSTLISSQPNARIHLAATILVIAFAILLNIALWEWAILALAAGMVWTAEALNTALEFLADRVAPEKHELVRKAKDTAAGGVLAAAVAAAAAGLLIFVPHFLLLV